MEKSETIVADRTCEYGNISHESSGDNALRVARPDHSGGLASIQAIALSECCSIVIPGTHRRKWSRVNECAEPLSSGRRQYPHANWICVYGEHSGVLAIAWIQGLICKVGKDLGQRGSMGECQKPTSLIVQGPADVVVVAMKSPITKRRSKGPLGSGGSLEEGTQDIAGNGYSSASKGSDNLDMHMCTKFGDRSISQTEREGDM